MGSGEHVLEVQSATCIVHVGRVGEVPGEDNHEGEDEDEDDDQDEDDHEDDDGDDYEDEDDNEDYEDYADQENILERLVKRVDLCIDQPPLPPKSNPNFRDRQNLSLK